MVDPSPMSAKVLRNFAQEVRDGVGNEVWSDADAEYLASALERLATLISPPEDVREAIEAIVDEEPHDDTP